MLIGAYIIFNKMEISEFLDYWKQITEISNPFYCFNQRSLY